MSETGDSTKEKVQISSLEEGGGDGGGGCGDVRESKGGLLRGLLADAEVEILDLNIGSLAVVNTRRRDEI